MAKKSFLAEAERDADVNARFGSFSVHEARSRGTSRLGGAVTIGLERIEPDPGQVRSTVDLGSSELQELAESITAHGVLQPLTVFYRQAADVYRIVSGERRYHAALAAGLKEVPCLVRNRAPNEAERTQLQLIENLHRMDMSPLDEAAAYQSLSKEHGLTLVEIGRQVGKSKSYISKSIRLCGLADDILAEMRSADTSGPCLGFEHLLQIAREKTPSAQRELYRRIRDGHMNVKEARKEAQRGGRGTTNRGKRTTRRFVDPKGGYTVTVQLNKGDASREDVCAALRAALASFGASGSGCDVAT